MNLTHYSCEKDSEHVQIDEKAEERESFPIDHIPVAAVTKTKELLKKGFRVKILPKTIICLLIFVHD